MVANLTTQSSLVSFDVGSCGVRACQLRRQRGRLRLSESLDIELGGATPDDQVTMARLGRMIEQGAFRGRNVGLVLSPPAVQFHALRMPTKIFGYPPRQIHEALAWEIARETRAEPAELEVRYWLLPEGHQEGLNVMAVALRSSDAHGWVRAFDRHGLALQRIDVAPCALTRAALWNWQPDERAAWGIVDIGSQRTVVTVCVGPTPVYVRTIMVGAERWTQSIARVFGISPTEAEALKRSSDVGGARPGVRAADADAAATDASHVGHIVFGAVRDSLDTLTREIGVCFAYVLGTYPELHVPGIYLTGGGAQLSGLAGFMQQHLDVPVIGHDGDHGSHTKAAPRGCAEQFGVNPRLTAALGGAILGLEAR